MAPSTVFSWFRTPASGVSGGGYPYTKKRRHRGCNFWGNSYSLRTSHIVLTCLCFAVIYLIIGMKLEWVWGALKKVKLRSSSEQHDHEDTANSGSHDLQGEHEGVLPKTNREKEWFEEFEKAGLQVVEREQQYSSVTTRGVWTVVPNVILVNHPNSDKSLSLPVKIVKADATRAEAMSPNQDEAITIVVEYGKRVPTEAVDHHFVEEKAESPTNDDTKDETSVTTTPRPPNNTMKKLLSVDFGYDAEISKRISVERHVPDGRHPACKKKQYVGLKLQATVVISVYNEEWHVLLRTIHSVINRTPQNLLKALIIVDDLSHESLLSKRLDEYVQRLDNVHMVRNNRRRGLIWSRMTGAKMLNDSGEILVFLDSHVEVNQGWLEPLLHRIAQDWRVVAVPMVDIINPLSWKYTVNGDVPDAVDGFRWSLQTVKVPVPHAQTRENLHKLTDPMVTPITSHGQFAVSRRFFERLGGFDTGMELYGGENLEMSFKAWMCGGRVEIVPCSRIGHVARGRLPSLQNDQVDEKIQRNLLRVAKTWMDDQSILYVNSLSSLKDVDFGNLTRQLQLKKSLGCQSFKWYLKHVYPSLYDPQGKIIADTEIRSMAKPGLCLDAFSTNNAVLAMYNCHGHGGNQRFWYTVSGELRRYDQCLDYWGITIQFFPCHGQQGNQLWIYMNDVHKIKHVRSGKCLTVQMGNTTTVMLQPCVDEDSTDDNKQKWNLNNFNDTAYEQAGLSI